VFRVKICGITNWQDAQRSIEAGCDALGFNFYPRSPRYVAPQAAAAIRSRLPKEIAAVGVFVNTPPTEVHEIAAALGLQYAQLHGEETPATVRTVSHAVPVIKAFRIGPRFRDARLAHYPASAFLLDGAPSNGRLRGGTGKTFDWNQARRFSSYGPIILAGGLTPENVEQAIRTVQPAAVDVASGVESAPGKKDARKLRAFLDAVAGAREAFV
jgi:phosphoribosylanthranilate isomerase